MKRVAMMMLWLLLVIEDAVRAAIPCSFSQVSRSRFHRMRENLATCIHRVLGGLSATRTLPTAKEV
jgi:hypothetical protein